MRPRIRSKSSRRGAFARSAGRAAWLSAALVLVVQLFGIGHFALFAHARCEHGELVHGAHADHAGDAEARARIQSNADSNGRVAVSRGEAPDGHEHCAGDGLTPAVLALAPAFRALTLLPSLIEPSDAAPARAVRAVAILALAPKSSPPA